MPPCEAPLRGGLAFMSYAHRFFCYPARRRRGRRRIVAEAVRVVRASGLPNQTDSMFTTIEGDWVGVQ